MIKTVNKNYASLLKNYFKFLLTQDR